MNCKICKKKHLIGGKYQYEGGDKGTPCSCGELIIIPHQTVTYLGLSVDGKHHYRLSKPIICPHCNGNCARMVYNCDDGSLTGLFTKISVSQPIEQGVNNAIT